MRLMEMNPDIGKDVEANDGYCPCAVEQNEDTKCPCKAIREEEIVGQYCICGRYMTAEPEDATPICLDD